LSQLAANRPHRIIKTVLEVKQMEDVEDIRETFYRSPCIGLVADIKQELKTSRLLNHFKKDKLTPEQLTDI
jgi:hypothetical protein